MARTKQTARKMTGGRPPRVPGSARTIADSSPPTSSDEDGEKRMLRKQCQKMASRCSCGGDPFNILPYKETRDCECRICHNNTPLRKRRQDYWDTSPSPPYVQPLRDLAAPRVLALMSMIRSFHPCPSADVAFKPSRPDLSCAKVSAAVPTVRRQRRRPEGRPRRRR
ncbi:hypothetical protein AAT19DRAFT_15439 [Rhodotorula toruloides]|uniref:Uncharacterized protein n=1 Tax=Rhodotorula toruloides TaxID=5286 RepID=A0A2T0A777_RHOTO|nr:hypothetical protein AAT19DRAFT_15439 [Rhodotorula toruloides]